MTKTFLLWTTPTFLTTLFYQLRPPYRPFMPRPRAMISLFGSITLFSCKPDPELTVTGSPYQPLPRLASENDVENFQILP